MPTKDLVPVSRPTTTSSPLAPLVSLIRLMRRFTLLTEVRLAHSTVHQSDLGDQDPDVVDVCHTSGSLPLDP